MNEPSANEMKSIGKGRLIAIGFWIGIGFIVPMLVADAVTTGLIFGGLRGMFSSGDEPAAFPMPMDRSEHMEKLVVLDARESRNGTQLVILGSLRNDAPVALSGIQLEAELVDAAGKFVYECSEYVSAKLQPAAVESFQIACGCGTNPAPDHASFKVRVVSVSSF